MPYSPGIQSTQAETISRTGENLMHVFLGIGKALGEQREEEKRAAQLTKTLRSYAAQAGILTKEQAEVMGGEELDGHIKGTIFKQGVQEQQQRQQMLTEQLMALRARAAGEQRQQAGTAAIPRFLAAAAQDEATTGPRLPGSALRAALGAAPEAAASPHFDNIIRYMGQNGAVSPDLPPQMTRAGDVPVVWKPGSQQFVVDPAYAVDKRQDATAETEKLRQQNRLAVMDRHEQLRSKVQIASDPKTPGQWLIKGDPADVQAFAESNQRLATLKSLNDAKASGAKRVRFDPETGQPKFDPFFGGSESIDEALKRLQDGGPATSEVQTPGPKSAAPVAPVQEPTATNPATGEKLVLRNGQWVPLQ
jgi:hypothetical protein